MLTRFVSLPWYVHAPLSGVFLMLAFYPFYLWPLAFIALVPLYLAASRTRSLWQTFVAGGIAFSMLTFTVAFLLAVQFSWLPASQLFVDLLRFVAVPGITLWYGLLFGACFLIYGLLRSNSALLNVGLGAALYIVAESVASFTVGGYYLAPLAHVAIGTPFMSLAALGGAFFVSFLVALVNVGLAEWLAAQRDERRGVLAALGIMGGLVVLLWGANVFYLAQSGEGVHPFTIAVVQFAERTDKEFATVSSRGLSLPRLEAVFVSEEAQSADLVVYPSSVIEGVVRGEEAAIARFAAKVSPANTLMLWHSMFRERGVVTGFQFYTDGTVEEKLKQDLLPFMDYTPRFVREAGVSATPFDVVPGTADTVVEVAGTHLGSLVCSEAVRTSRAREEAPQADVLLAAGTEAMFLDDAVGLFTLRSLQYRAVENNIPVVRASLFGPSALIERSGALQGFMPQGEGGVLSGMLTVGAHRQTLFTKAGYAPLALLIVAIFGVTLRTKFLRRREQ